MILRWTFALLLALPGAAMAQSWPSQPVRMVVPFAPAGATDIFARVVAERLSGPLGQRVVVENRPGAGATLGAQQVARANDGHTLLVVTSSHTIGESLMPNRGYELLRDFAGVAPFNATALALAVTPSLPARDFRGLIEHARRNPGALSYATTGNGTVNHLAGELIRLATGIDWVHVPYRAGAEARTDLIAGRVPVMFDPVTNAAELARDGRVRVLAVTAARRSVALPDVPTLQEGGIADADIGILIGLVAPAATPPAVVARLNREIATILADEALATQWRAQGAERIIAGAEQWQAMLAADVARWAAVVRQAGVRVE